LFTYFYPSVVLFLSLLWYFVSRVRSSVVLWMCVFFGLLFLLPRRLFWFPLFCFCLEFSCGPARGFGRGWLATPARAQLEPLAVVAPPRLAAGARGPALDFRSISSSGRPRAPRPVPQSRAQPRHRRRLPLAGPRFGLAWNLGRGLLVRAASSGRPVSCAQGCVVVLQSPAQPPAHRAAGCPGSFPGLTRLPCIVARTGREPRAGPASGRRALSPAWRPGVPATGPAILGCCPLDRSRTHLETGNPRRVPAQGLRHLDGLEPRESGRPGGASHSSWPEPHLPGSWPPSGAFNGWPSAGAALVVAVNLCPLGKGRCSAQTGHSYTAPTMGPLPPADPSARGPLPPSLPPGPLRR